MLILLIIFIAIAYALGSINTAILVCKAMNLGDPRTEGSQNPGATNVLRLAGKRAAMITLVADGAKGFIPVILARMLGVDGFMLGLVAIAAMLGHIYPAFFGFKGGKGVATGLGAILGLSFLVGLIAIAVWIVLAALTRYASLASLASFAVALVLSLFASVGYFVPVAIMTGLAVWRHWDNIQRLQSGNENKMDFG